MAIAFGKKVKDKVSGFTGIVTGNATYITGCNQYLIVPPSKDGDYIQGTWLDEGRLEEVEGGIEAEAVAGETNGSDLQAPRK